MPLYLSIGAGVTFSKNWSCPSSNRLLLKDRGDHVSPFCMDQECKFTKITLYIIFGGKSWFWFSSGFHIQLKSDPVNCGLSMRFSVGSSQSLSMDKLFFIEFPTFPRIDVQALLIYKVLFLVRIFLYSARIHENADHKNSVFGHVEPNSDIWEVNLVLV